MSEMTPIWHQNVTVMSPKNLLVFATVEDQEKWWAFTDLNCGPTDYESGALTN